MWSGGGDEIEGKVCITQWHPKCRIPLTRCLCAPPCTQFGLTALFWAADEGHLDIVKLLLERGAQKDLQDKVRRREGCGAAPMGAMRRGWQIVCWCEGSDWEWRRQLKRGSILWFG